MQLRQVQTLSLVLIVQLATTMIAADKKAEIEPPIVTPSDWQASPPSDAKVLFNGTDLTGWVDDKGNPSNWKVENGEMVMNGGNINSVYEFTDAQIHLEFNLPENDKHYANSGVYIHKLYEVQVIDSYRENKYKPYQQCGSLYTKFTPMVNATLPAGQWQSYDIIFHGAKVDDTGKVTQPARVTVFHNGVLIQYNRPLLRGTGSASKKPVVQKGPLRFQDHGSPVRYRNIWARPIAPVSKSTGVPYTVTDLKNQAKRISVGTPGTNDAPGKAPSDATFLFDGSSLEGWESKRNDNPPAAWKVEDGYMEVVRGTGSIRSKAKFGDVQLHVEWATPSEVKGSSQGRGNSGVFLHDRYEVQVLDSFENKTYFNGQASAIYGQYAPQVNASRGPGKWQTYDIVFRAAKYDEMGKQTEPGGFTVLHNGVLVQDHVINKRAGRNGPKDGKPVMGPLHLQDHGNPVRYRNIWFRSIE